MERITTEQLSAYLAGDLSADEVARVEAALQADPALQAELEDLRAFLGDLSDLPAPEPSGDLLASVLAAVADLPIGVGEAEGDEDPALIAATPAELVAANQGGRIVVGGGGEASAPVSRSLEAANDRGLPWWVKGPLASAIAALLVVGVGIWFAGRDPGPPAVAQLKPMAASAEAPRLAPAPTGGSSDGAALADLEEADAARERLRALAAREDARAESEPLLEPTPQPVAVGNTVPARAARPAPAREEPAATEVFVAEFERGDEDVEVPPPGAPDEDDEGDLAVAAAEDAEPEQGRTLSVEEVSFGAAPAARAPAAPADAPAGARATLKLAKPRSDLDAALRGAGWQVRPAGAGRLQVVVPAGQEQALVATLRAHGSLVIEAPLQAVAGSATLTLTLR